MTESASAFLHEPARRIPVIAEADVVILGGGPAGLAAAACSARQGASTLLVERYGFLGGMGTAAGVTNFCGLFANVHGEIRRVVHGIADELLDRMHRFGGLKDPHDLFGKTRAQAYDMPAFKLAADELLIESGAQLLFHALGAGVCKSGDRTIDALIVETKSGRGAVRGRMFIDASGDGDLAHWAGARWEKGDDNGHLLYPTLMFRVNGVDPARADAESINALMAQAVEEGRHRFPRKGAIVRPQKNPAEWRANVTQIRNSAGLAMDGTDAMQFSAGEIEGRRQVGEYFRFLRERVPGFEASYILDIAPQVGIRETRRVVGRYMLTADDVLGCASFSDTIGVNGWPLEQHVEGDVKWTWPAIPQSRGFNHLPLRMLISADIDNLLVAGRCASMTSAAQSAARVSGGCFVMGQAAGTCAALAIGEHRIPADVDVATVQARLERDGAWLGRET